MATVAEDRAVGDFARRGSPFQQSQPLSHTVWERDFQSMWDPSKLQSEVPGPRELSSRARSSLVSSATLTMQELSARQASLSRPDASLPPRATASAKRKADSAASLDSAGSPKQLAATAGLRGRPPAPERCVRRKAEPRDPEALIEAQKARRRESARRSRLKKKDYQQQIEEDLEASRAERDFFKAELAAVMGSIQRIAQSDEASAAALKRQLQPVLRRCGEALSGDAFKQQSSLGTRLGGLHTLADNALEDADVEGHSRAWLHHTGSSGRLPVATSQELPFSRRSLTLLDPTPPPAPMSLLASSFSPASSACQLFSAVPQPVEMPQAAPKSFPLTFSEGDIHSSPHAGGRTNESVLQIWEQFRHN